MTYGTFETVEALYSTPGRVLWSGHPAGNPAAPANCCIKVITPVSVEPAEPVEPVESGGLPETAPADLLLAAAVQQAVAGRFSGWAPVLAFGEAGGGGAYQVTRLYGGSVQGLIDAQVKLRAEDLIALLLAIVEALTHLQTGSDRPHGNLKPTNVLLADPARLQPGTIALSDPAPQVPLRKGKRLSDESDLGALLYALVTSRPAPSRRHTAQISADWKRLGPHADAWLLLCNQLFQSETSSIDPGKDLAQLSQRIAALRFVPSVVPEKGNGAITGVAWVIVGVILLSGIFVYRKFIRNDAATTRGRVIAMTPRPVPQPPALKSPPPPVNSFAVDASPLPVLPPPKPTITVPTPPAPVKPEVVVRPIPPPLIVQRPATKPAAIAVALSPPPASRPTTVAVAITPSLPTVIPTPAPLPAPLPPPLPLSSPAVAQSALPPAVDVLMQSAAALAIRPVPQDWAQAMTLDAQTVQLSTDAQRANRSADVQPAVQQARNALAVYFATLKDPAVLRATLATAGGSVPDSAPPWFQLDAGLQALRQQTPGTATQAQWDRLSALASRAGELEWAAVLAGVKVEPFSIESRFDSPEKAGWRLIPSSAVSGLPLRTYSFERADGSALNLQFARIVAPGEPPCYLATTDVSVALLRQSLAMPGDLKIFGTMTDAAQITSRPGIHVWQIGDSGVEANPAGYPDYARVEPIDATPVQYVSAEMAMYAARCLHCRLPTAAETRAAYDGESASTDPARHGFATQDLKLRSDLYQQLLRQRSSDSDAPWPDAGVFGSSPGKSAGTTQRWPEQAVASRGWTLLTANAGTGLFDGDSELTLNYGPLLRDVGQQPGVFHDLVGNVAQWVLNQPSSEWEQVPAVAAGAGAKPARNATVNFAELHAVLKKHAGDFSIMGGSALSPPSIDPLVPQPVADVSISPAPAYADVGFRLAFTEMPADQRQALLDCGALLLPPANDTAPQPVRTPAPNLGN